MTKNFLKFVLLHRETPALCPGISVGLEKLLFRKQEATERFRNESVSKNFRSSVWQWKRKLEDTNQ